MFILLLAALHLGGERSTEADSIILFLGFLPLLNALFDFLSIGLTRLYLRRGLAGWGPWHVATFAFVDLLMALVTMVGLVVAIIGVLHLANTVAAQPLIDLGATLRDIHAHPGEYWWLYLTLFSTLLPTLVHLVLGIAALLLFLRPRQWIVAQIDQIPLGYSHARNAAFVLALADMLGLMLALALPAGAIWGALQYHPDFAAHFMALADWFAALIGVPMPPDRPTSFPWVEQLIAL